MRLKHCVGAWTLAAAIAAPALAAGQVADTQGSDVAAAEGAPESQPAGEIPQTLDARYRVWGESLDLANFDGGPSDQLDAAYQNVRADVRADFGSLGLRLSADLFTGRLLGEAPPPNPDTFKSSGTRADEGEAFGEVQNFIDPRNAYVEYRSVFLLRAGLQTSNFGMGLVANDGVESDWELFNQQVGGDRGFRALLGTRPFALSSRAGRTLQNITVAVGGDIVYRDDNASFLDEDRARQAIGTIFYEDTDPQDPENSRFLGAYFAYRDQNDANGDDLRALAADLSGKTTWNDDADMWFYSLGAEAALLSGETNRTFTQTGELSTDVLALGAAAEAEVRWKPLDMSVRLKGGYASGDANPDDDTLYRFRFDPNYKVGLILFDHYIPAMTRTGYERAADPSRSGVPPKGVAGLISDGAVENAVYLNPMLLFGNPDSLLTGVGILWAQSAVPLYDPFNSFANGGTPIGPRGAEASRDLGVEVDVAARYRHRLVSNLQIEGKAEYGILFPGEAFNDALGNPASPQNLVRARIALLW
jgi:hypothetical protein